MTSPSPRPRHERDPRILLAAAACGAAAALAVPAVGSHTSTAVVDGRWSGPVPIGGSGGLLFVSTVVVAVVTVGLVRRATTAVVLTVGALAVLVTALLGDPGVVGEPVAALAAGVLLGAPLAVSASRPGVVVATTVGVVGGGAIAATAVGTAIPLRLPRRTADYVQVGGDGPWLPIVAVTVAATAIVLSIAARRSWSADRPAVAVPPVPVRSLVVAGAVPAILVVVSQHPVGLDAGSAAVGTVVVVLIVLAVAVALTRRYAGVVAASLAVVLAAGTVQVTASWVSAGLAAAAAVAGGVVAIRRPASVGGIGVLAGVTLAVVLVAGTGPLTPTDPHGWTDPALVAMLLVTGIGAFAAASAPASTTRLRAGDPEYPGTEHGECGVRSAGPILASAFATCTAGMAGVVGVLRPLDEALPAGAYAPLRTVGPDELGSSPAGMLVAAAVLLCATAAALSARPPLRR